MTKPEENQIITGKQAQSTARWMSYGNLLSMVIPFPIGIFWFGASMVVYALNRHHPNPRVGFYTQQAAYQFYSILGFVVVVATFFGTDIFYWMVTWGISAAILIPLSIYNLVKIKNEQWIDTDITADTGIDIGTGIELNQSEIKDVQ